MADNKHAFEQAAQQAQCSLASEFLMFLAENKKWWLLPILIILGLIGLLALVVGTGAAPFIYTIF